MRQPEDFIASDSVSAATRQMLAALLNTMIPPNEQLNVPGAGDEVVVDSMIASIRKSSAQLIFDGLKEIDTLCEASTGQAFADLDPDAREKWFHEQDLGSRRTVRVLGSIAVHCYYTEPQVMKSLGMEARAPFPDGFSVEQGDWSLLDQVRSRERLYKDVSKA